MSFLNIPIVQVALAVLISWALFAILIGLVQEAIAQIIAERGRFLKDYILKQLRDDANGINWGSLLYQHGSIDLLIRESNKPTNDINPAIFSQALVDVVAKAHVVQANRIINGYQNRTLAGFKSAMQTLQHSDVVAFLRLALNTAELKASASQLKVDEGEIYNELLKQVECWYNEFMERVSLWYKKRMRQKLFFIGIIVALIVNVDSIQLFNFFRVHPESSAAVINYYDNYVQDTTKQAKDSGMVAPDARTLALSNAHQLDSLAKAADLPVGFEFSVFRQTNPHSKWYYWWKLLGLALSGFAASLGAPFWFDILKKLYTPKTVVK